MKLTILGGGGFRVPLVYKALMADTSDERVDEVRLYDTDPVRLSAISKVLGELAATSADAPRVMATTDLAEALAGVDFVFSAMRVGGTEGRAADERIALHNGVIGQETVGAGGISYALRGIPVIVSLVEQLRKHAPEAWVINFTNPAGVITEVMQQSLGDRVVGICDSPVGLARRVLTTLQGEGIVADDIPPLTAADGRVRLDYAGLNHLGWLTGLHVDGDDVLPTLLERADLIESFEEGRLFGAPLVQALGCLPNEYLHYYYFAREDLLLDSKSEATRGVFLAQQQRRFYEAATKASGDVHALWEQCRLEREATYMASNRDAAGGFDRDAADLETGGYDKVALAIMHAIANDVPARLILNVANRGILPDLDDTAVVEVPCDVDGNGIHPLPRAALPDHGRGIVVNAKYVERRTIAAALHASRSDAMLALAHHPLVDSVNVARDILDDLVEHFHELAYLEKH